MTIRFEANPPKINPNVNFEDSINRFLEKIKLISTKCDAIHLTENVLGYQRVSPLEVGRRIRKEIPQIPITFSLRVRDKDEKEIQKIVDDAIKIGFSGILVLKGDPSKDGKPDSNLIPSDIVKNLREYGIDSKIDLYLSISNNPNFEKIKKKIDARPKGFITQVIQSTKQVKTIVKNLKDFKIIPIVLFPSKKNQKSADFLKLDLFKYEDIFEEFVAQIHKITGDVLITSPNDFAALNEFLSQRKF